MKSNVFLQSFGCDSVGIASLYSAGVMEIGRWLNAAIPPANGQKTKKRQVNLYCAFRFMHPDQDGSALRGEWIRQL